MSLKLKPCPFCGKPAEPILIDDDWKVSCGNEFCKVYPCTRRGKPTRDEAAVEWNVRGGNLFAAPTSAQGRE